MFSTSSASSSCSNLGRSSVIMDLRTSNKVFFTFRSFSDFFFLGPKAERASQRLGASGTKAMPGAERCSQCYKTFLLLLLLHQNKLFYQCRDTFIFVTVGGLNKVQLLSLAIFFRQVLYLLVSTEPNPLSWAPLAWALASLTYFSTDLSWYGKDCHRKPTSLFFSPLNLFKYFRLTDGVFKRHNDL
jgi:hypothetical protein